MHKFRFPVLALLLIALLASCIVTADAPSAESPMQLPKSPTPIPTETPRPGITFTPAPTETPTPAPTHTPTPAPTETPAPTLDP